MRISIASRIRFAHIVKSLLLRNQPAKPSTEHRLRATSDCAGGATLTIRAGASRGATRPAFSAGAFAVLGLP
jgi:hypothetical protein